jgi:hypothetical protein
MRFLTVVFVIWFTGCVPGQSAPQPAKQSNPTRAEQAKAAVAELGEMRHKWEYINYPHVRVDDGKLIVWPMLYPAQSELELRLMAGTDKPDPPHDFSSPEILETNSVSARLVYVNGKIVAGNTPFPCALGTRGGGYTTWHLHYRFPWGSNVLEEAWVELKIGKEQFWLEVPYGFTRNPNDPLVGSSTTNSPMQPVVMNLSNTNEHVLCWTNVHYDLGPIQNGWRLSLIQSNPFDGESEVELYRDDSEVGKSIFLWDLHSPRTALRIISADGERVSGHCREIRLHDDGIRRSDKFFLGRTDKDNRCWGVCEIDVDGKTTRCALPSSLFKYVHGHAR